ncbi:TetR/AcrR family transcriptional regulator [Gammaproteobacteria bacterium]|nr:TetR/AcrR family transcriptional regulator [Gammaproteobacteria bacterium]
MASKKGSARAPTRRPGIDRYDKVLGAAEEIILENESLDGLTLQAIAAKAKVPRVSLYYFFPSIDAVIEALYQRILTRLISELSQSFTEPDKDWKKVMTRLMTEVRNHYRKNTLTTVLALTPPSPKMINEAHIVYGEAVASMLVAISSVPESKNLKMGCEIAAEIGTTIFRKSYLEKGTITDSYLAEALNAVIAYLDTVISPKKVAKVK